jgi:sec-independent protein translocase protein TatB
MFPEGRIVDFVIVGIVALIVVGPKDLPVMMRRVGQFMAKMRGMAAEFRASFDEMARQSELDELRKELEAIRSGQTLHAAVGLGEGGEVAKVFEDIHAGLRAGDPVLGQPAGEAAALSTSPAPLASPEAPLAGTTPAAGTAKAVS